jgi:hypothetical protein
MQMKRAMAGRLPFPLAFPFSPEDLESRTCRAVTDRRRLARRRLAFYTPGAMVEHVSRNLSDPDAIPYFLQDTPMIVRCWPRLAWPK